MLRWLIGIILCEIICESSNWQHIPRLKITILGANWQLFRLDAKCSYFILSTQNMFYWIVMKIKKFMLPIWWYNRDLFPLRNKYNVVFSLNGFNKQVLVMSRMVLGFAEGFCLPTIFHIFAHTVHTDERSTSFGYLVALGSVGQTVAALVRPLQWPSKETYHIFRVTLTEIHRMKIDHLWILGLLSFRKFFVDMPDQVLTESRQLSTK